MRSVLLTLRHLRRGPSFGVSVVLILALALGANATVLALLRGLVLRALPVPSPHELVIVTTRDAQGREGDLTWGQFQELNKQQRVFSSLFGSITQGVMTVDTGRGTVQASVAGVSGAFYHELGGVPVLGRLIDQRDLELESATAEPVVVLSWSFWTRQFAGDPTIVGRTMTIEGQRVTVIGVAPQGFRGVGIAVEPDVTVPLPLIATLLVDSVPGMLTGTMRWVTTVGRLAPGRSLEAARAHIDTLWPALREAALPSTLTGAPRDRYLAQVVVVQPGTWGVERRLRDLFSRPLVALMALAGLLLVTAAVNLASLMFARSASRQGELAMRLALGAGRVRILRDAALEGGFLGLLGGLIGSAIAASGAPALAGVILQDYTVPTTIDVAPDALTWLATLAVGTLAGLTMAVVGVWAVTGRHRVAPLGTGARVVAPFWRVGRLLVGAQVAASVVVLAAASSLTRSVLALTAEDPGYDLADVYVGYPRPHLGAYRALDVSQYYEQALAKVKAVPGVEEAAFSTQRPEGGALRREPIGVASTALGVGDLEGEVTSISPGFFKALRMPLLEGRDFMMDDQSDRPRVVVVSRSLGRRLFGDRSPVGRHIRVSALPDWQDAQIVGVVGDARVFDVRHGNRLVVYTSALQWGESAHYKCLVVRASASSLPEIRRAMEDLGAEFMPAIESLHYIQGRTLLQERLLALLSGGTGALSLLLVAVGMYGLLAYVHGLRRKEIGIRMALGAEPQRIARMVLGDAWRVCLIGSALGLATAVPGTTLLRGVLVGTASADPTALALAVGLILLAATLAAAGPALRAARVSPLLELRRE